ncbi:MAG: hypothetical protein Fur007_08110 [Rhodoferax sp.]
MLKLPMDTFTTLAKFVIPVTLQEIELQQRDCAAGGMPLLRTRIREKSRFTVFDIDPHSAMAWGQALVAWAQAQTALDPAADPSEATR